MTSKYLDEFRPIPHLAGSETKSASSAVELGNFDAKQIDDIWTSVWKSGDPKTVQPELEKLSEADVVERMLGKWTVMFGVIPDKLTITLHTNRLVEVSGQKDGTAWKKTGQWRVASDKLVLSLKEDSLPSFIFRTHGQDYIFDPWAKPMMSELKPEK